MNKKLLEDNFSLSFWTKVEISHQVQSGEQGLAIYSSHVSGLGGLLAIYLPSDDGILNFRFHDSSSSTSVNFVRHDLTTDFSRWNQIIISKNNVASIFFNSKMVASGAN